METQKMVRLGEMSILEKANALEACIAKADLDVEYAINVKWESNAQDDKNQAKVIIQNARELFSTGRLEQLDLEVKADAYATWNIKLDTLLRRFPEYSEEKDLFKEETHIRGL